MRAVRPGPGTPVTVVGLARSGAAAARWLLRLGAVVRVTEMARKPEHEQAAQELEALGAVVELGKHSREFVEGAHLVVVSPGVPLNANPVVWARNHEIPVRTELELGSWYCRGKTVAVTGSNGKSTVVTMLGQILNAAGKHAVVCGNIGTPLCAVLDQMGPRSIAVLEVSSFQLEYGLSFHTDVSCLLNVTDNHLDRHGSFAHYRATKGRLFARQAPDHWALLNADDPGSEPLKKVIPSTQAWFSRRRKVTGAYVEGDALQLNLPSLIGPICKRSEIYARGKHHEENALAAAALAGILGVRPEQSGQVLKSFEGLPHRQKPVGSHRGVTFIDDSKSTTVASGISAIEAAPGPVILIAGGRDKGSNFRLLRPFTKKLRAAVLIGEDGYKIADSLKGTIPMCMAADLNEAVKTAFELAKEGECVLLSPMCTSFDMFRDFEERGEKFSEAVRSIAQ